MTSSTGDTPSRLDTDSANSALIIINSNEILIDRYHQLKSSLESVETPALLAIGLTGFAGACFSLAVFLREREQRNDYFLYKIISICEAAQMLVLTIVRLSMYCNCEQNYTCSFFWAHISISVMNVCADVVDFLILFLCIERTWACLLPFEFKNLNKRSLERSAVVFAFVCTILFSLLQAFEINLAYDSQENRYRDSPSKFAESDFYSYVITANTIRFYATACAIIIATALSVFGFWRTARRSPASSSSSKNRDRRREMDLCCLQLCTAAPVVVNHLLYAISLRISHHSFAVLQPLLYDFLTRNETNRSSAEFETTPGQSREIDQRLRKAEAFEYLKTSTNLSDALAHALQFYFYLIFCLKVRQGFLALFLSSAKLNGYRPTPIPVEETPMLAKKPKATCLDKNTWWSRKSRGECDNEETKSINRDSGNV